ncbi:hypothetical protein COCMIDRAFT_30184 [Bipolaris oryzae ATCC 44560]|uniref:Uncharacterized protein n=1 Tax=Bipolaris oryzae ATCC 44560 TaxID=930090 RepID=W6YTU7_COCMI|nr:uncharacterized protein COCMIDRAFT_30184 [Bipolaris oryzae ATCC 44560]EUC40958.1 hypothetical protein COCMIDRAFT_30184 [Bipolaris oryzae ATCC 44560]
MARSSQLAAPWAGAHSLDARAWSASQTLLHHIYTETLQPATSRPHPRPAIGSGLPILTRATGYGLRAAGCGQRRLVSIAATMSSLAPQSAFPLPAKTIIPHRN